MRALLFKKTDGLEGSRLSEKETSLTDYDVYLMTKREKIINICLAAAVIFMVGFVFYRSFIFSALLTPFAFLYPGIKTEQIIASRKNELTIRFKDLLYSLSSSLYAGKSVESAFKDALKDLSILYPNSDEYIICETQYIVRKIEMNQTIESALSDFAGRAHLEDVDNFVDVFYTCKRTGGNIVEIIKNTSNIINDKIEIKQEIDTLLAERRLEQKVLNVLPILMIILISVSADDYIRPVFDTAAGKAVMTVAMALLVLAYFISKKIMDIKV